VTAPGSGARSWAAFSDDEIVDRVRSGDVASYEILMRRYNQRLYRAVRAILGDDADVEDVMQEAYLAAYRHLDGFAGRARFSTWLIRIAVNQALDRLRRTRRSLPSDPLAEDALGWATGSDAMRRDDPEQCTGRRELARLLERAIEELPEAFRAAYVLRELEGVDAAEAAQSLGIEEATLKTRVHRARQRLRAALGPEVGAAAMDAFRFGGEACDRVVAAVLGLLVQARSSQRGSAV
jgi:RNA polymerase sigma-70 factor (ECF subfamily)